MTAPQKFEFTKKAIQTRYRGYEFRSRLEAKWACFFDLCGWRWAYEPPELPGWIPDFAVGDYATLVEVRPYFDSHLWHERREAIMASGYRGRVILLGADPVWLSPATMHDGPQIGWLHVPFELEGRGWSAGWDAERDQEVWESYITDLHYGFMVDGTHRVGMCPMDDAWVNLAWKAKRHPLNTDGETSKAECVFMSGNDRERFFVERWATATNVSQWMPLRKAGA